ncbi:MAG: nucleoside 2-deoxyribosyltransferase [bacterium]
MKIYIICPVRKQTEKQTKFIEKYVNEFEKNGHSVFYPKRDAPQECETGYRIIESELNAIKEADSIHVFWDVESKGSHFDLGMAYALNKDINFIYLFQSDSKGKSYVKAMKEYYIHRCFIDP